MEWYQEWREFQTELTAEELRKRLKDETFLHGYGCKAKLLSNDHFYIASTEGSVIQEQFVFSGSIRTGEEGVSVVGDFGWSSIYYAAIGIAVAAYFAFFVAMGASTGNAAAGLISAIVVFPFIALFFGMIYAWDSLTKDRSEVTWKDVHANTVLYFIKRGLILRKPEGWFITADDLNA